MSNIILDATGGVIYSLLFYRILSGFLYDVTLRRLAKASFNLTRVDILDLSIAYFIAILSFIFIYLFIQHNILTDNPISNKLIEYILSISKESFGIYGIILIFLGRVLTRKQGAFYGKLHFSSIFISSSILLVFDFIIQGRFNFSDFASNISLLSISHFMATSYQIIMAFINLLYGGPISHSLLSLSIVGTVVLSTIGESYLSILPPDVKSVLAVTEKFPTDFKVITGVNIRYDKIRHTIDSMFEGRIISVKCVTKTLVWIDLLEENIRKQQILNPTFPNKLRLDYRILKAPKDTALDDYKETIEALPYSFAHITQYGKQICDEAKDEYDLRSEALAYLQDINYLSARNYYFKDIVYLITEDQLGSKKLLYLVKDRSAINSRVGLYTEQPYIIELFENIFENAWTDAIPFSAFNL